MGIRIAKWYLDAVDERGAGVICYAADIRWRRVRIGYSAVLQFDADGRVEERMTLRGYSPPMTTADGLTWGNRRLGCRGSWTRARPKGTAEGSPVSLLETPAGDVRWQLKSARMRAQWSGPNGDWTGLGYVERLEMTIPPWQLPIEELRWGRFVGETADAAWIEWRGPQPLKLEWRNGVKVDSLHLDFHDRTTLREGPLVKTVFSKVPVLRKSLPMAMLGVHETKWRSRASLDVPGDGAAPGWAIHEAVQW